DRHPEMLLRRHDIACFCANWNDKATNLRLIAQRLNIGLDALVFVDDSPFERNLVRCALPQTAVPELPEDPALFAYCLGDAGYFEGVRLTGEDRQRTAQYQANSRREALHKEAVDLGSYLRGLGMRLLWRRFDRIGLQRAGPVVNKTNQFNLTNRRYTENEILAVIDDPRAFGLTFRLIDRFGDNGVIAVVIGRASGEADIVLDTWLMSCRVLGRQVEEAMLQVVVVAARE